MEKQSDPINFDNLPRAVAKVSSDISIIKEQLEEIKSSFGPKPQMEFLTRKEVAEMFKCDLSTIHNWTKKGKLRKYAMGDRAYYKRSEVELALQPI